MRETNRAFGAASGVNSRASSNDRQHLIFPIMTPFNNKRVTDKTNNIIGKSDGKTVAPNKVYFSSDVFIPSTCASSPNPVFNVSIPRTVSTSKFYAENKSLFNHIQKEMAECQIPMCLVQDENGKLHQLVYTLPKHTYEEYVKGLMGKSASKERKIKTKLLKKSAIEKDAKEKSKKTCDNDVSLNLLQQLSSIELSKQKNAENICKSSKDCDDDKECIITYSSNTNKKNKHNSIRRAKSNRDDCDDVSNDECKAANKTKCIESRRENSKEASKNNLPGVDKNKSEETISSTKGIVETTTDVLPDQFPEIDSHIRQNSSYHVHEEKDRPPVSVPGDMSEMSKVDMNSSVPSPPPHMSPLSSHRKRKSQDSQQHFNDEKIIKLQTENPSPLSSSSFSALSSSQEMTPGYTANYSPDPIRLYNNSPISEDSQSVSNSSLSSSGSDSPVSFLNLNSLTSDTDCFLTDSSLKVIENSDFQDLIGDFNPDTADYLDNLFDHTTAFQANDYFDLSPDLYTNEPLDFRIFEQNNFSTTDCIFF